MINENNIKLRVHNESGVWKQDLFEYKHSIFHCAEWINPLCKSKNLTPLFIDFLINNEKVGKISGLITNNRITGRQLYFYSGPALKKEDYNAYLILTESLLTYAKDNKYSRIILGSYGAAYSPQLTTNSFYTFCRKEFVVNLNSNSAINYSRNFKRKLKKAELIKPEISIFKPDTDTIKVFLQSTHSYRQEHGKKEYNPLALPYLNYEAMKLLLDSTLAKTYSVTVNNRIDGFIMTLENKPQAAALLLGLDNTLYQHGISACMYDYVFNRLSKKGFKQINLGGIPEGVEGRALAQFKKSMGAEDITVYGATTNFLTYPYKLLNPILNIGRKLPKDNQIVKFLKRFI